MRRLIPVTNWWALRADGDLVMGGMAWLDRHQSPVWMGWAPSLRLVSLAVTDNESGSKAAPLDNKKRWVDRIRPRRFCGPLRNPELRATADFRFVKRREGRVCGDCGVVVGAASCCVCCVQEPVFKTVYTATGRPKT